MHGTNARARVRCLPVGLCCGAAATWEPVEVVGGLCWLRGCCWRCLCCCCAGAAALALLARAAGACWSGGAIVLRHSWRLLMRGAVFAAVLSCLAGAPGAACAAGETSAACAAGAGAARCAPGVLGARRESRRRRPVARMSGPALLLLKLLRARVLLLKLLRARVLRT